MVLKRFLPIFLASLGCFILQQSSLWAQQLRLKPDCDSAAKPFATILAIDNRTSPLLGAVQKSIGNVAVAIRHEGPVAPALAKFFARDTSAGTAAPDAVLMLHDIFLTESSGMASEEGFFKLVLRLFARRPDGLYGEVFSVDTTYVIKGFDVTAKLLRSVSDRMCALASASAGGPATIGASYSLADVLSVDSLEKRAIPAYADAALKPGIYRTFEDFKQNKPEPVPLRVKSFRKGIYAVYDTRSKSDLKGRIHARVAYAVVVDTLILKSTPVGFYRMVRAGGDYYFRGMSTAYIMPYGNWAPLLGGLAGGVVGSLAASGISAAVGNKTAEGVGLYRIHHLTGREIFMAR